MYNYTVSYSFYNGAIVTDIGCHRFAQAKDVGEALYQWMLENVDGIEYVVIKDRGEVCYVVVQNVVYKE